MDIAGDMYTPWKSNKTVLECPPFQLIVNVSSNNLEPNLVIYYYIHILLCFLQFLNVVCVCCLADEEFDELCFQFGIELDEVVSDIYCIIQLTHF